MKRLKFTTMMIFYISSLLLLWRYPVFEIKSLVSSGYQLNFLESIFIIFYLLNLLIFTYACIRNKFKNDGSRPNLNLNLKFVTTLLSFITILILVGVILSSTDFQTKFGLYQLLTILTMTSVLLNVYVHVIKVM